MARSLSPGWCAYGLGFLPGPTREQYRARHPCVHSRASPSTAASNERRARELAGQATYTVVQYEPFLETHVVIQYGMENPIEIQMDDTGVSMTPLEEVAAVMAALIDSAPDVEAQAYGTRIEARSAGVLVKMTVTAVEADASLVLSDE